jgi:DNA-binding CsgD family transcriptional regulator
MEMTKLDFLFRENLTPKQLEYVAALASGRNTFEIAAEKYVSHHTVRNTINKAKERVGATSTYNLVAIAVEKDWIIPDNGAESPVEFIVNHEF